MVKKFVFFVECVLAFAVCSACESEEDHGEVEKAYCKTLIRCLGESEIYQKYVMKHLFDVYDMDSCYHFTDDAPELFTKYCHQAFRDYLDCMSQLSCDELHADIENESACNEMKKRFNLCIDDNTLP